MPEAKTMLDKLARALEARKMMNEAADLGSDPSDRALMEYDRLMRIKPGKRVMQEAFVGQQDPEWYNVNDDAFAYDPENIKQQHRKYMPEAWDRLPPRSVREHEYFW